MESMVPLYDAICEDGLLMDEGMAQVLSWLIKGSRQNQ
jgi:hypothetical protein